MARYLYSELASLIDARKRCERETAFYVCKGVWTLVPKTWAIQQDTVEVTKHPRWENLTVWLCRACRDEYEHGKVEMPEETWFERHSDTIERLVKEHMPSGSGFDNGTKIDLDASHADKLVFTTAFHHMNAWSGAYDGWTDHTITVTPSLTSRFHLRISGRDRNEIKEYIHETFDVALSTDLTDEIEYARLSDKLATSAHLIWFAPRWIDPSRQVWEFFSPDMNQTNPAFGRNASGCAVLRRDIEPVSNWIEARHKAIEIMQSELRAQETK